jgi:hypothetical protein
MSFAPCPLLGNGSLNTFPQKQTRGIIDLLLGNGAVNRLCQQYRLCFPCGSRKVDIRESRSEAGSCGRTRMRTEGVQRIEPAKRRLDICCSYSETVINPLPGYD